MPELRLPPEHVDIRLMRSLLCSLIILAALGSSYGIELPLILAWDSHNELSYLPSQSEKEYNWREFYRIGIGLDSLSLGDFKTSFLLLNRADFISNQVEISEFRLGYTINRIELSAASLPFGYGRLSRLNPLPRISANMDEYRYQATRFNRFGLAYNGFELLAGGNQHNQAMLSISYTGFHPAAGISYKLAQEGRIRDSHWTTPVAISSAELGYWHSGLQLSCDATYSRFIEYDKTPGHDSFYALTEVRVTPFERIAVNACAEYKENEPTGFVSKFVDGSLSASFGKFYLSPGFRIDKLAGDSFSTAYFSADWLFLPGQRIGLHYRCENLSNPVHILGLQASLDYRL